MIKISNKKIEYFDKDIKIKYNFLNKKNNEIGYVIFRFTNIINLWDMEYKVEPKFQKKGYGTKMLSAALDDIFAVPNNPAKISIQVAEGNLSSVKLATKVGFELIKSPYGFSGIITKEKFLKTRQKLCEGLSPQQN